MAKIKSSRYGIGEWFGHVYTEMDSVARSKFASIKSKKDLECPYRKDLKNCNKSGGVCTMVSYTKDESGFLISNSYLTS